MVVWYEEEEVGSPEKEIVEENFFMDENLIKNKALIRVDINLIQYPLFSKNTKRKVNQIVKYFFNKNRDTYINITPKAGDYIPGELEEKVFIALLKIMKKKGMPRVFVVTLLELKTELKLTTKDYVKRIRESLSRLASSNYNFKNTMYSSANKSILTEEIETTILSLKTIQLGDKENQNFKEQISDKRIKEVYEISISDYFYNNIMTKGYMVYNSDILLNIDTSIARAIYMLIEKLRYNSVYLKIDTLFLIKRVPLKFSSKNPHNTIKTLESNFDELKAKKLIKDFKFIKETTWEKSEVEFIFYETSQDEKQVRFFEDFNDFKSISTRLTISATELDIVKKDSKTVITKELLDQLFNSLPNSAKKLKSMPKTLLDSIEKYGEQKVKLTISYMKKQKNLNSPRGFFLKSLENDWAATIELENLAKLPLKKNTEAIVSALSEKDIILEEKKYLELEKKYDLLTQFEKEKIENSAFENYIKLCGSNTKIQKIAFKAGKRKIILDFLSEINFFEVYDISTKSELKKETVVEQPIEIISKKKEVNVSNIELLSLAKEYLNNLLIILEGDFSKDELLKLKMNITKEILSGTISTIDDVQEKVEKILLSN
ncbi:MAG: hypothetical protein ACRCYT_03630 [Cetobacterium sp.]